MSKICPECKKETVTIDRCYYCYTDITGVEIIPQYTIDKDDPVTFTNVEINPNELDIELNGRHGIKIHWDGNHHGAQISTKESKTDEWKPISGVQSIDISISVDKPLPVVTIKRIVLPGEKSDAEV